MLETVACNIRLVSLGHASSEFELFCAFYAFFRIQWYPQPHIDTRSSSTWMPAALKFMQQLFWMKRTNSCWSMKIKILQKHNQTLSSIFNTKCIEVLINICIINLAIKTICYFCFSSSDFVFHWTVLWEVEFERICVDIIDFILINV